MIALSVLALLLSPESAAATKLSIIHAKAPGGVSAWPDRYSTRGNWTVSVEAGSDVDLKGERSTLRIHCEGATLASGDSVIEVTPGKSNWHLVWKRSGEGPVRIRCILRVQSEDPESYDLYEFLLVVRFHHLREDVDTVLVQDYGPVRAIAARDGQQYRYGGMYFVAIGNDEVEAPRNYERRADVVTQGEIRCTDCGLAEPLVVPVVITVGSKGKVTWARPAAEDRILGRVPQTSVDSRVWRAVERGLRSYKYRSAMAAGRPVADSIALKVRVVP